MLTNYFTVLKNGFAMSTLVLAPPAANYAGAMHIVVIVLRGAVRVSGACRTR